MRARKNDDEHNQKRADMLIEEICADMKYVRAYFEGGDTKGRIR